MDELENDAPEKNEISTSKRSNIIDLTPPKEKPTVVDVKFTLTKKKKIILAACGVLILILAAFSAIWFTDLKYQVFGAFFKASTQIIVTDSKTSQPIEGATVKLDDQSRKTDKQGKVTLQNIHFGKQTLEVTKEAYKDFERGEVIFFGSNELGPVKLEGAGIPISFIVKNSITGLPVQGAIITVSKNSVKTSSLGTAIVNVLPGGGVKGAAKITKDSFISGSLSFSVVQTTTPYSITLTPEGKTYFLSNRSGKIDLYESNLDGTEQKVILHATGSEEEYTTGINISPDNKWIAFTSSRDGARGTDGNLLPYLYLISTETKSFSKINGDQNITVYGWVDNYLIFSTSNGKYGAGGNAKLLSYDTSSKKQTELVNTTSLQFVNPVGGVIFYGLPESSPDVGLFKISPDGSGKKQIKNVLIYYAYETSKTAITFSDSSNNYYSYDLASDTLTKLDGKPASLKDKDYIYSGTKLKTAFVDFRDGKNDLFVADSQGANEKQLTTIGSVTYPVRWIGDEYIIFRVSRTGENADYVIGVAGGDAKKIVDVFEMQGYGY